MLSRVTRRLFRELIERRVIHITMAANSRFVKNIARMDDTDDETLRAQIQSLAVYQNTG